MKLHTAYKIAEVLVAARDWRQLIIVTPATEDRGGVEGVARSITDEDGNFLHGDDDIDHGAYVWLTGDRDYFIPLDEITDVYDVTDIRA